MTARRLMIAPPKKDKGSIVLSLVIHVFVIVAIASITFRYPLSSLFTSRDKSLIERVQYVRVAPATPRGAVGNGAEPKRRTLRSAFSVSRLTESPSPSAIS